MQKRSNFTFSIEDVTSYMSNNLKLDVPKKLFEDVKEKIDINTDDETLNDITSLNAKSKAIEKNINKRVLQLLIFVPLSIFLIVVIYKTYETMQNESVRETPSKKAVANKLDLRVDETFKWRILKDQETQKISNEVKNLKSEIKGELNNTINIVNEKLNTNSRLVKNELNSIRTFFKENQEKLFDKLKSVSENQKSLENLVDEQKEDLIELAKKELENTKNYIPLPELPPLKGEPSNNSTSKDDDKDSVAVAQNSADNKDEKKTTSEEIVTYEEVSIDIETETIEYSTIDADDENGSDNGSELPSFTLMPGFIKGTLVNGGEAPVLLEGESESAPIFIRINGDELIANDASVNIDGCLILATSKADLSKRSIDLRLSKISCNIVDLDGNSYKIDQKIEGWVFGENGSYGLPGRLVSREQDIIKAGLPLAVVESMITSISTAVGNSNSNFILPNSANGAINYDQINTGAIQGVGTGASAVLQKFSDYYLKMLDSLNPTISIRAGRKVVIAFKGGEELAVKKYIPINTAYFEDEDMVEEDSYVR